MLKHINNFNKNNLFKRSLCNLAINNDYLFIEKINYHIKKKYLTITKKPYYLDEDFKIEDFKKMHNCLDSGNICIICNGNGYILNKNLKYDVCKFCNGSGIN